MPKIVTQDASLCSLIPKPLEFHEGGINGRLFIDGNITHNCLLFRFRFDDEADVSPIFLTITTAEKTYRFSCAIRDLTNPEMKTQIISPDFNLCESVKAIHIEPFFKKNNK